MPFQPGQSGNPSGYRKKPISDAVRALLSRDASDPLADKKLTYAHLIAIQIVKDAASGDKDARRDVKEWTEGKAQQALVGDDDLPPIRVLSMSDQEIIKRYKDQ